MPLPNNRPPLAWTKPQFAQLVQDAPDGPDWLHEIKFDGYRMHARIGHGDVGLLTRNGLDWTAKYPTIAAALRRLPADVAYLDGELCGVRPDGTTSFDKSRPRATPAMRRRSCISSSMCSTSTAMT